MSDIKKWVVLMFGKHDEGSKIFTLFYWFAFSIYSFYLLVNAYYLFASPSLGSLASFVLSAVLFPLLFRLVYSIHVKIQKSLKVKR
ncbi:hypothetical protein [Anoxybacteroides tepidamans]|uniref:hypothetical protein n=1 Tax=Anoxybacteroides tepidamans TaxID=265948 RepID=UPI0005522639|nr:hypothetical protein [Anoxybacillus tepidamans]